VLSERVPSVRSAAVGVWVRTASAHEPRPKMGMSHLLEHMVFKGTERRSAQEIALALESRGGSLDAYTSRDSTAYHARVLDADLSRALDVLTDMVRRPTLRDSDLSLERQVVLEEISTVEDTPDDEVFDLAYQTLWPNHPYGFQILGTKETVSAISTDDLKQLHSRAYFPGNCVIAAAGNLTHEDLLKEIEKQGWFDGSGPHTPPLAPALTTCGAVAGGTTSPVGTSEAARGAEAYCAWPNCFGFPPGPLAPSAIRRSACAGVISARPAASATPNCLPPLWFSTTKTCPMRKPSTTEGWLRRSTGTLPTSGPAGTALSTAGDTGVAACLGQAKAARTRSGCVMA